ncbi:PREDICTED: sterile alpha motif domain-containing protein 15 [Chrysochloris asiatica]|uniref:Sterile alpha motif domain-containing protein 15 n=1 Tax=Chrysochloris asiatica TaxID=185453 RepID=A0A9B0TQ18_CHRAS|nr:PREDICTED: sterile alpha motif domain-containing protein 15 [Chrysochloris asiatica]
MAEVPENNYSGSDEDEDPSTERPKLLKRTEGGEPDNPAEVSQELPIESHQELQPKTTLETEEDNFEEGEPENVKNMQLKPTRTPKVEISNELGTDVSGKSEPKIPQKTSREMGGEFVIDPEFPLVEKHKELYIEPQEEILLQVTENVLIESVRVADLELPKETKSEVLGTTHDEARLELLEKSKPEVSEESLREQYKEIILEPPELTKLEFPSDTPRKSVEETDLQPQKMTKTEIPDEAGRKSVEEQGVEPLEQTTVEFPEQESRKSIEAGLEPPEKTKPEIPEETLRKLTEEQGTVPPEQTSVEFPEQKPRESTEDTRRSSTKERVPEALEEMKSEFPEEKSRKSVEETGLEPLENTKSEESRRESNEEKIPAPLKETDPVLPQEIKPEVQELPDETKPLFREGTNVDSSKDDRLEPIKFQYSGEVNEQEHPNYQIKKLSKKDSLLNRDSETELSETDDEFSKEPLKPTDILIENASLYSLESLRDLEKSLEKINLSEEMVELVFEDKETPPEKEFKLQFEYLKWSPKDVAEWISQLGFPQYKGCFTTNFISGQKLIYVNCSNLPQMGITDFEDMKIISRHTRELLGIEEPLFKRSITLPYRDNIGLFLEQKSHTGEKSNSLTLSQFVQAAGLQDYAPQIPASTENQALC